MRRIQLMEEEGVKFICNANVGENVEPQIFLKEFDATVLCTGATQPRDLPVDGRDLQGVHFAMEYPHRQHRRPCSAGNRRRARSSAAGTDVVVIGGGDTGTDCVGTAMRQGCRSLVQIEILPKPPLDRAPDNPWPEWPKIYKHGLRPGGGRGPFRRRPAHLSHHGEEVHRRCRGAGEGAGDRADHVGEERKGAVRAPGGARDRTGASRPAGAAGDGFPRTRADPPQGAGRRDCDARTNIKAEHEKYATNLPGVFAAGDCRRGQSLVVWAINEGRGAARECDRYLMGSTDLP